LDSARVFGAESSSLKKPCKHVAALTFPPIMLRIQMGGFQSSVFLPPVVLAAFAFSPVQRRVHIRDSHAPVFSAPAVLKHISEPEKRLINGGRLLIYSVNRFHFDFSLY
jgi:hypothetical protein